MKLKHTPCTPTCTHFLLLGFPTILLCTVGITLLHKKFGEGEGGGVKMEAGSAIKDDIELECIVPMSGWTGLCDVCQHSLVTRSKFLENYLAGTYTIEGGFNWGTILLCVLLYRAIRLYVHCKGGHQLGCVHCGASIRLCSLWGIIRLCSL